MASGVRSKETVLLEAYGIEEERTNSQRSVKKTMDALLSTSDKIKGFRGKHPEDAKHL